MLIRLVNTVRKTTQGWFSWQRIGNMRAILAALPQLYAHTCLPPNSLIKTALEASSSQAQQTGDMLPPSCPAVVALQVLA